MHVVIFSGGILENSPLVQKYIKKADLLIAADSGADTALGLGVFPDVVVGDEDSISKKTKKLLEKKHTEFITHSSYKDGTDTELAIGYALKKNATEISLLGGTYGERIDHILTNIFLSVRSNTPITYINGNQLSKTYKGPQTIHFSGKKGDLLSLIPLSDVSGLISSGLEWELKNETLSFGEPRGVSN